MTCSICQHPTARDHYKPALMMGVPGVICWFCFLAWYERSFTNDVSIRRESIMSRENASTLQEPG